MEKLFRLVIPVFFVFAGSFSCREKSWPKPHGYFRIEFPGKTYYAIPQDFPYSFRIPDYAQLITKPSLHAEPYWINIAFPSYHAEIHISYKKVRDNLFIFTEESHKMAYDHAIKASSIEEGSFHNPAGKVYGTIYMIHGNAASPMQFYLTDSVEHFLRGSLYIRAIPNIDSLKPVIEFLKQDALHLVETLEWTK